jgi:hypothetical protein
VTIINPSRRKIIAGATLLLVGIGITIIKGDIPPNLLSLMQLLYGTFVLGNAFQHATETYASINKKGSSSKQ